MVVLISDSTKYRTCVVHHSFLLLFHSVAIRESKEEFTLLHKNKKKLKEKGSDSRSALCRYRCSAFAETFWVQKHCRPKANHTKAKTNAKFENKDRGQIISARMVLQERLALLEYC